jgi:hypothetical protein
MGFTARARHVLILYVFPVLVKNYSLSAVYSRFPSNSSYEIRTKADLASHLRLSLTPRTIHSREGVANNASSYTGFVLQRSPHHISSSLTRLQWKEETGRRDWRRTFSRSETSIAVNTVVSLRPLVGEASKDLTRTLFSW